MAVLAPVSVIDPIAVADVKALLAAIPPDCELHEPGEDLRKIAVELPSVDLAGNQPNDIGAAAWPVAAGPVRMGSLKPSQDPGPVQKVVDQSIDGDQLHPDFQPLRANVSRADQNVREAHRQDLVSNAVDIP